MGVRDLEYGHSYSSKKEVRTQKHQPPSETPGVGSSAESDSAISIDELALSIKDKLDLARLDDDTRSWSKLSIYRVPHYLPDGDTKAYVPQIVSIGPFHCHKEHLRPMHRHKWRSLERVLKRTNQDIKLYLESIGKLEKTARACYEGPIYVTRDQFVVMMVLDGCFVLELLRGAYVGFSTLGYGRDDPVFTMRGSMALIQRDMLMLENQIPLFILVRLLELGCPDQSVGVATLVVKFFDRLMRTDEPRTESDPNKLESCLHCLDVIRRSLWCTCDEPGTNENTDEPRTESDPNKLESCLHCLDVTRRSLWCTCDEPGANENTCQVIRCVTELRDAGIKFKKRETNQLWDIKFENGVLEIPALLIDGRTKSLFLNLIAFEQRHHCADGFSSYALLMDNLINSSEDVRHLRDCGIIEHLFGNDDKVADLFNGLCHNVVLDMKNRYLWKVTQDINKYYKQRWHAWRAALKQKYFSNPWAIISVIAGVVLLLLTIAQTFYGIYGYYRRS